MEMIGNDFDNNYYLHFSSKDNAVAPTDITRLVFADNVRYAEIKLLVVITADKNLYTAFDIKIMRKGDSYVMVYAYLGDNNEFSLSIRKDGQVEYTSGTYTGFSKMDMKFKIPVIL
jgi:hypothetical protein